MTMLETAREPLWQFKGDTFVSGCGVLPEAGRLCAALGRRAVLVRDVFPGSERHVDAIVASLLAAGVEIAATIPGAAPTAPLADLAPLGAGRPAAHPGAVV